jgi:hypothetical protein
MTIRKILGAAAVAAFAVVLPPDSSAQTQRTFVSPVGTDANACALATPCRTFARAITQTLANGEIVVLDSGGYGAVDITKSVSIISPDGVYAGISVFPSPGYGVQITGSNLRVVLRNLQINGQGGTNGILIPAASVNNEVYLERVTISNLPTRGLDIAAPSKVSIKDSILRDNSGYAVSVGATGSGSELTVESTNFERNFVAIDMNSGPNVKASIVRSAFANNDNGIGVGGPGAVQTVTIADSSFTGTGYAALTSSGSATVQATVRNSTLSGGNNGVLTSAGVTFILDGDTITGNTTGVSVGAGVVRSAGNNAINGNTTNVSGSLTTFTPN